MTSWLPPLGSKFTLPFGNGGFCTKSSLFCCSHNCYGLVWFFVLWFGFILWQGQEHTLPATFMPEPTLLLAWFPIFRPPCAISTTCALIKEDIRIFQLFQIPGWGISFVIFSGLVTMLLSFSFTDIVLAGEPLFNSNEVKEGILVFPQALEFLSAAVRVMDDSFIQEILGKDLFIYPWKNQNSCVKSMFISS